MQHPFFLVDEMRAWLQGSPLLQRLEQRLAQVQEVRGTAGAWKQLHLQEQLAWAHMCSYKAPARATAENEPSAPSAVGGAHLDLQLCHNAHSRGHTRAAAPALTRPPLML